MSIELPFMPIVHDNTDHAAWDVSVFVSGTPASKGSKSYKGMFRSKKTGRKVPILVESAGDKLADWRDDVRCALAPGGQPIKALGDAPIIASLHFVLYRPKSTSKKKTPAAIKKPDIDKLERAILDAAKSAGIYRDDSQVVGGIKSKRIAEIGETTGCLIQFAAVYP